MAIFITILVMLQGFPGGSEVKASACNAGDPGSIPGSGRSPGEGNGNPLQYSYLENPMDGGAWWATVHEAAKSQTRLSDFTIASHVIDNSSLISVKMYLQTRFILKNQNKKTMKQKISVI